MAKTSDGVMVLLVILLLGTLTGGEVIGALAPDGYVAAVFPKGISPGITPPPVLDLKALTVTLGAPLGSSSTSR